MARIVSEIPNLSRKGSNKAFKDALDAGLKFHQENHLKKHFQGSAANRYGSAYTKKAGSLTKTTDKRNSDRAHIGKETSVKRKTLDPNNVIPLLDTGQLKDATLNVKPVFIGPARARKMKLDIPRYAFINPGGQIDKIKALKAVTPGENIAVNKVIDKVFQKYLNINSIRRSL